MSDDHAIGWGVVVRVGDCAVKGWSFLRGQSLSGFGVAIETGRGDVCIVVEGDGEGAVGEASDYIGKGLLWQLHWLVVHYKVRCESEIPVTIFKHQTHQRP